MRPRTTSDVLTNCLSTDDYRLMLQAVVEDSNGEETFRVATDTHRLAYLRVPTQPDGRRIIRPDHLASALDVGKYPTWRRVLPSSTQRVAIPIDPLIYGLQSVGVLAKRNDNLVIFEFDLDVLTLRARSETLGEIVYKIALPHTAPKDFKMALNARYVLDAFTQ